MKVLIRYVSMTSNTEDIMIVLKNKLETLNCEVKVEELDFVHLQKLSAYDLVLFGSYTWGDGDLPYELEDMYEDLDDVDLTGISFGIFGSGDRFYPAFCQAVDLLADKVKERGGDVFSSLLKIEFSPDSEEEVLECEQFAVGVYEWVKEKDTSHAR